MIHQAVDERLRMLDTHAHGETFVLHSHTYIVKHAIGVMCRVTYGEDNGRLNEP